MRKSCIVDQYGHAYNTGYISSGSHRASMRGWNPSANSADADMIPGISAMRASSRDLSMNSGVASAMLGRYKDCVIGHGLYLQSKIDREFLKLSPEQAEEWEKTAEREFKLIAESQEIDAERTCNLYELMALVYYSKNLSGDVFFIPLNIPRPGVPYDLRIKTFEADMVSNPNLQMDSEKIAGGVEVDENKAPVAYHISKYHPGGLMVFNNEWERIPIYASQTGFRQVYHLYNKLRPGQRRGYPLVAPIVEALKQSSRLKDSELMAAVVTSLFTAFIKTTNGDDLQVQFDDKGDAVSSARTDPNSIKMGSGTMVSLADKEDIVLANPTRPNALFRPFYDAVVEEISCACNIPPEVVLLKFTSSYSASRAALLLAFKTFLTERVNCGRNFCQPIYERILLEAVLKGRINAPGFIENAAYRKAWSGALWIGQGVGQINPSVETKAALDRIAGRISTHAKETALIDGDDWDSMNDILTREEELIGSKTQTINSDLNIDTPEFKGDPDE